MTVLVWRWRLAGAAQGLSEGGAGYAAALIAGAAAGGFGLGSLNLYLSGEGPAGRSIIGALVGAILAIEIFKAARARCLPTIPVFVNCPGITVGRPAPTI